MSRVQCILDIVKKNTRNEHGARNIFRAWKQKSKHVKDLASCFKSMGLQSTLIQKHYQLMQEAGTTDPIELRFYKNTRPGKPLKGVRKVMCNVLINPKVAKAHVTFPINKRIQEIRRDIIIKKSWIK
tara:strand:+ start:1643 stop:2023 length:381 start_codon:yes stop_codon:yes gene_type:complete